MIYMNDYWLKWEFARGHATINKLLIKVTNIEAWSLLIYKHLNSFSLKSYISPKSFSTTQPRATLAWFGAILWRLNTWEASLHHLHQISKLGVGINTDLSHAFFHCIDSCLNVACMSSSILIFIIYILQMVLEPF